MGLFDAYKGSTTELDGNFNEFVPQYIQAKLNGTESVRKCLYRILSEYSGLTTEIKQNMSIAMDLEIDDIDFVYACQNLKDNVIFQSRDNECVDWINMIIDKFNDQGDVCDLYCKMTVADLEAKINSGSPMCAVKIK